VEKREGGKLKRGLAGTAKEGCIKGRTIGFVHRKSKKNTEVRGNRGTETRIEIEDGGVRGFKRGNFRKVQKEIPEGPGITINRGEDRT